MILPYVTVHIKALLDLIMPQLHLKDVTELHGYLLAPQNQVEVALLLAE